MESRDDTAIAIVLALGLHALALLALVLGNLFAPQEAPDEAGPVIAATLEFTSEDLTAAQAAVASAQAEVAERAAEPEPQPVPEPDPQTADEPLQDAPQEMLPTPDTEDQDAISELAEEPSDETEEQQARQRQEQIELTEEIARQKEAENRQRVREQYEAIRREREEATRLTRMEEQRLKQLEERRPVPTPPTPMPMQGQDTSGNPRSGQGGIDVGLRARYIAALNTTARDNWNTGLAPERVKCEVRFRQVPGGEVINVEFMRCPYDAQGRESVERALRKTQMPYSGFETVFSPTITLTFCHPEEACQ
jgi:colicin import membrane protein